METFEQQRDREKQENATSRKVTRAKLVEVFELLGFTPKAEDLQDREDAWGATVHIGATKEDMELYARANAYNEHNRVRFSIAYPKPNLGNNYRKDWPFPEASFTLIKTPAQLSDGVKRRIMPEYLKGLALVRAANKQTESYHKTRDENLSVILNRELTENERKEGVSRLDGLDLVYSYGDIQAHDDVANLKLYGVPVKLAKKIVDLLRAK